LGTEENGGTSKKASYSPPQIAMLEYFGTKREREAAQPPPWLYNASLGERYDTDMTRREVMTIGSGLLLLNCSGDTPRKSVEKPPEPVTGLHAL
jgi:hypothetical protein